MLNDLKGKVIVVIGGATGIGAAASRAFGQCGSAVLIHYFEGRAEAESLAAEIGAAGGKAETIALDITKPGAVDRVIEAAIEAFGRIDVLVNNAGSMVDRRSLEDIDDALIDAIFDLNVRYVVHACKAVLPIFRRQGGGAIINVSSIAARAGGSPGASLYAGAKGFISTFTRSLARELAPDRIRVNAVSPGVILTRFHDEFSTPERLQQVTGTVPLGRLGVAEDCAGAFLWLASEALGGYVTGQVVEVNGGQLMP